MEEDIVNKYLKKATKKTSHAFLFNIKQNEEKLVFSFIKSLFCDENDSEEKNKKIINKIDKNIYSELKIIRPKNSIISKEEIKDTITSFFNKPLENKYKICYIIEAEKMNKHASNSMLKFLEEPNENIKIILSTDKINLLPKTIISRCQIINPQKNFDNEETMLKKLQQINKNITEEHIINTIEFIKILESKKIQTINYTKTKYIDLFKEKTDIECFFDVFINFYQDIINYDKTNKPQIFDEYIYLIKKFNKTNKIEELKKAIKIKERIYNNVNNNLLIDKLIIDIKGDL